MKKTIVLLLTALCVAGTVSAQQKNSFYVTGGWNFLYGDFHRYTTATKSGQDGFGELKDRMFNYETGYSFGFGFKHKMNDAIFWRANALYSRLNGNDARSTDPVYYKRGYAMKNNAWAFEGHIGWDFLKEKETRKLSGYLYVGIGFTISNPKLAVTYFNADKGPKVDVGSKIDNDATDVSAFKKSFLLSFPFGLGLRYAVTPSVNLGLEYSMRLTGDWIDGLGNAKKDGKKVNGLNTLTTVYSTDTKKINTPDYTGIKKFDSHSKNMDWYGTLLFTVEMKLGASAPTINNQFYHRAKYY
jgi:opacity protein-like surface antigen